MSYTSVVAFKNGVWCERWEQRNSWGGAARVWGALFDKYLKDGEYDSWLTRFARGDKSLWDLAKDQRLPQFARVVHAFTFDRAIVDSTNFKQLAKDCREFERQFPPGNAASHLPEWSRILLACSEAGEEYEAIGLHATSVTENPWSVSDPETGECTPYNLHTGDMHFEIYEYIRRFETGEHP